VAASIVPFLAYKEKGRPTAAISHSKYVDNIVLAAGVAETVTRPTNAVIAVFACTADFYVDWHGSTAIDPTVDKTNGLGVELNPASREIGDLSTFSVISASNADMSIAWYGGNS